METILIATDFSAAARNATKYGFDLAGVIRGKIILFTAFQSLVTLSDSAFYVSHEELEKDYYQRLSEEAESIDPRRTVALETLCTAGPISSSILAAVAKNSVSYVVLSIKDTGKEIRKYFGSTVTDLCKHAVVPLIVVPANAVFSITKNIALASDISDETDVLILEPIKNIAERFQLCVHVVRVITSGMNEAVERLMKSKSLNAFFKGIQHSFEYIKADNIAKAFNEYVNKRSVSMVAVVPHQHTFLERLFVGSVTKDILFETSVPLLVLPEVHHQIGEKCNEETYNSNYYYGNCQ